MHAFKKIYFLRHVKTRIGILASYQNSTSCTCKMVANVSHCHHYYLLSLFISSFNDQSKWLYTGSFEYTNNAESYAIERVLSANSFACFRWRHRSVNGLVQYWQKRGIQRGRECPSQLVSSLFPNWNQKQPAHSRSCFKFFLKKITVLRDLWTAPVKVKHQTKLFISPKNLSKSY